MAKVVPVERQSLFDIALQSSGSIEAVFALAVENNISLTDMPTPGVELEAVAPVDTIVLSRYNAVNIRPATGIETAATKPGIGGMGIEIDFIIN